MAPVFQFRENTEAFYKNMREELSANPGHYGVYIFDEGSIDYNQLNRLGELSSNDYYSPYVEETSGVFNYYETRWQQPPSPSAPVHPRL